MHKINNVHQPDISEIHCIFDEIDYLVALTQQMEESLRNAYIQKVTFPSDELAKIRQNHTRHFHKIREFKRILGEYCQNFHYAQHRSEIRNYLHNLEELEIQTAANIGTAANLVKK